MGWSSQLGNSERRYLVSVPLQDLSPVNGRDLTELARTSTSIDLPYLLAGAETGAGLDLYVVPGGKPIPVRAATFDVNRQVYSLALDDPQRILTWTPIQAPGSEEHSSTHLPPVPQGTVIYTGSSQKPLPSETESYPALDLLDQERLIITFPIDSGLPPILVVFKSRRYEPGTAVGTSNAAEGPWPGEAAREEGASLPARIANLHRGKDFRNFDTFRRSIWKSIANDPELAAHFDSRSLRRMAKGNAPIVDEKDIYMSQLTYVLHHVTPISEGGGVYDMTNIRVVTPLVHNRIHYGVKP